MEWRPLYRRDLATLTDLLHLHVILCLDENSDVKSLRIAMKT